MQTKRGKLETTTLLILALSTLPASALMPDASAAMSPTIDSVGVSFESSGAPFSGPISISQGGVMRLWYLLNNPNSISLSVILGGSIVDSGGRTVSDPPSDRTVTIPAYGRLWYSRYFYIGAGERLDTWTVIYGLWKYDWSTRYDAETRLGWLRTISPVPLYVDSVMNIGTGPAGGGLGFRCASYSLPMTLYVATQTYWAGADCIQAFPPAGHIFQAWQTTGSVRVSDPGSPNPNIHVEGPGSLRMVFTNTPPNQPSSPSGSTSVVAGVASPYSTFATDPNGDSLRVTFVWGDGQLSTTPTGASGSVFSASHVWSYPGTYTVTAYATDRYGATSAYSAPLTVVVTAANRPPNTPSRPSGPTTGTVGIQYTFSSSATDPDGNSVRLTFDFGDGVSATTGLVCSGCIASTSHAWSSPGVFNVIAKATDANGAASAWSPALQIAISTPLVNLVVGDIIPAFFPGEFFVNVQNTGVDQISQSFAIDIYVDGTRRATAWSPPTMPGGSNWNVHLTMNIGEGRYLVRVVVDPTNIIRETNESDNEKTAVVSWLPPSTPLNPSATATSSDIDVFWSSPVDNGGWPVTNYRLYRGISPGTATAFALLGNVFSYTDTTAEPGITYYYSISAINIIGEGPRSSEVSAQIPAFTPRPLEVWSVNPKTGTALGGTAVTITGTGFLGADTVTFGTATASFVVRSDSELVATAPPLAPGTVRITVHLGLRTSTAACNASFLPNVPSCADYVSLPPDADYCSTIAGVAFEAAIDLTFQDSGATITANGVAGGDGELSLCLVATDMTLQGFAFKIDATSYVDFHLDASGTLVYNNWHQLSAPKIVGVITAGPVVVLVTITPVLILEASMTGTLSIDVAQGAAISYTAGWTPETGWSGYIDPRCTAGGSMDMLCFSPVAPAVNLSGSLRAAVGLVVGLSFYGVATLEVTVPELFLRIDAGAPPLQLLVRRCAEVEA